jgi:Centromere DNA-binding protein complex CBF3 subunit, domain 2
VGQKFLKLLKRLRNVFLQDSVLLRRRFSGHAIWDDAIFATPEYAEFAERVIAGLDDDDEEPHLMQIERANLLIAGELQTLGRTVASAGISIRLEITRQQRSIVTAIEEQRQIVENLCRELNRRPYIND